MHHDHYHWSSAPVSIFPWVQEITKLICELRKRWIHSPGGNLEATSSEPGTWSWKSHRVKNPGGGPIEIDPPQVACLANRRGHGVKAPKPISRSPGGKRGPLTEAWGIDANWDGGDGAFSTILHVQLMIQYPKPMVVCGKVPLFTPFYGCMGYKLELALHRKKWKNTINTFIH